MLFIVTITSAVWCYKGELRYEELLEDDHEAIDPDREWYERSKRSVDPEVNEGLEDIVGALGRQLLLTQLNIEERVRSEGGSGLKQVRVTKGGTRPYYFADYTSSSVAAIHEHSNNIRTVGLGEFVAVLNGVEFRTRHNDYRLKQPVKDDLTYHATEDIEFPEVPTEVQGTVEEQIEELRVWFKAFHEQNTTLRDYRPYFQPILCYLEGAWTLGDEKVEEPFKSDRHVIEEKKWVDLQEKIRFTSATGRKDQFENLAYLPTKILEMVNGTYPKFAQWNYRILCHKMSKDLPLHKLRPVDDISTRFSRQWQFDEYLQSRAPRFQLHDYPPNTEKIETDNYLDILMHEIPGKDNYGAHIVDEAMDATVYDINSVDTSSSDPLNAAYYHRYFKVDKAGAMGLSTRHRGFSDPNLFVALNNQPKIAPFNYSKCDNTGCELISQRVSFAIPLEIVYLTPLSKWNPYNIIYKGETSSDEGKTVTAENQDGVKRNGKTTLDLAYNGTSSKIFYQTPVEFFADPSSGEKDAADTASKSVAVLDDKGELRNVSASGTRIFLPVIAGVGRIRQRYPIMPIYAEGNAIWKKLAALEDSVMYIP